MNAYNDNLPYWEGRYKEKGKERTVGLSSWSSEQYKEANRLWEEWFRPYLTEIRGEMPNAKMLDFGCGPGRWMEMFCGFSFSYYGADILDFNFPDTRSDVFFSPIKEHKIPFDTIQFDFIFTCVALQHVIDDSLLAYYADQMVNRLMFSRWLMIVENTAKAKDNVYIKFRSKEFYTDLFVDRGLKLIAESTQPTGGEPHSLLLFKNI